jgi:TatD DNase family protein
MIDTHCHLTDPRLASQLPSVLDRAAAAGVQRLLTIGTGPDDAVAAIEVCRRVPVARCAIGLHPNYVDDVGPNALDRLAAMHQEPSVLAVGEIGLDYFHDKSDRVRQRAAFIAQVGLANRLGKPIVIHSREAVADALSVLRDHARVAAVFHCFTGTPDEAAAIAAAGYYVGFDGPLTYKKNDVLREAARLVPRDRVLIETDAPYLSPEPVRSQKTNEPANVAHVLRRLAALWQISEADADAITTANAERLFGRW